MRAALCLPLILFVGACQPDPVMDRQESIAEAPSLQSSVEMGETAQNSEKFSDIPEELSALIAQQEKAWAMMCEVEETPIFGCTFADGKQVSVCGSKGGEARYRFGGDETELEIEGGVWANVMYSGGGESQILFENGDTHYIAFSRMVRTNFTPGEPNNPAISDGVIVERAGALLSVRRCDDPMVLPVQYDAADAFMTGQDELFTQHTIQADPEWANK